VKISGRGQTRTLRIFPFHTTNQPKEESTTTDKKFSVFNSDTSKSKAVIRNPSSPWDVLTPHLLNNLHQFGVRCCRSTRNTQVLLSFFGSPTSQKLTVSVGCIQYGESSKPVTLTGTTTLIVPIALAVRLSPHSSKKELGQELARLPQTATHREDR